MEAKLLRIDLKILDPEAGGEPQGRHPSEARKQKELLFSSGAKGDKLLPWSPVKNMELTGIKVSMENGELLLKRALNICFTQIALDAGCALFTVSIIYSLYENVELRGGSFPLLLLGILIWVLFYLRRLGNLIFGRVKIDSSGVSWNNSILGGWTQKKNLKWNEIEKIYTEHENLPQRNRDVVGYFLKIQDKTKKTWTLLRCVATHKEAVETCHQLNEILKNQTPLYQ